jgi:hypothetical protein
MKSRVDFRGQQIVDLWISQNSLMWSRLKTLYIIQSALMGSWFFLCNTQHFVSSFFLLFFGTIIIGFLLAIIKRDKEYLNAYGRRLCISIPPPPFKWMKGRNIFPLSVIIVILFNFILMGLSYFLITGDLCWNLF